MKHSLPANVDLLVKKILEDNPMHRQMLTSSLDILMPEDLMQLEDYILYCMENSITIDYLSESYLILVTDTLREQIYFNKHKKYRYSTFADVADSVYFNKEYMSHYMHAVALSLFFWPNHLRMFRF